MRPVVTTAQMRALDERTIGELGVPGCVLMENAGRHVAEAVLGETVPGDRVAVVCGGGGNGGDGFVCARWLAEARRRVTIVLVGPAPRPGSDAALYLAVAERLALPIVVADGPVRAAALASIAEAQVIVDAIFGTGLSRPVVASIAEIILAMNGARGRRVAVDVPSGLDADTGAVLGACVEAHLTVTFAAAKAGLVSAPGFEHAGVVRVVDIGIPAAFIAAQAIGLGLVDDDDARTWLPPRPPSGHKGTFGHLLVIAGSSGKSGAALLAASAGLRAGAGLVTLALPARLVAEVEGRVPEIMLAPLDLDAPPAEAAATFVALAQGKRAVAIGPGIPQGPAAARSLGAVLAAATGPIVLDADALNHVARTPGLLTAPRPDLVMTPHPGEAGRLLGVDAAAVQADRIGSARRLAAQSGGVCVLKGARTVVAEASGAATINPTGNPGMGTGGAGDVLTGVIGALLAQGLGPSAAARLGVFVHGRAGDLAAQGGERGLIAGDLVAALPGAFGSLGDPR
jgi:NAD(P)H-hydrate epimerase